MEPEMAINQIQRERECQCVNVQELTENVNLQNLRPKIAHILGVEASSRGLMVSAHRGLGVKDLGIEPAACRQAVAFPECAQCPLHVLIGRRHSATTATLFVVERGQNVVALSHSELIVESKATVKVLELRHGALQFVHGGPCSLCIACPFAVQQLEHHFLQFPIYIDGVLENVPAEPPLPLLLLIALPLLLPDGHVLDQLLLAAAHVLCVRIQDLVGLREAHFQHLHDGPQRRQLPAVLRPEPIQLLHRHPQLRSLPRCTPHPVRCRSRWL